MTLFRLLVPSLMLPALFGCSSGNALWKIPAPVSDLYDSTRFHALDLGPNVNFPGNNYSPSISPDGLFLYYSNLNREDGRNGDIYVAEKSSAMSTEFIRKAVPFDALNSTMGDGCLAFSEDSRMIVYVTCNRATGLGDCDLYRVIRMEPEDATIDNLTRVNSVSWDSDPSLSLDGRDLYFVSNRTMYSNMHMRNGIYADTPDRTDIYHSRLSDDGVWGKPEKLPDPITSPYNESSPTLSLEDGALFFGSDRPGGYGGYDLYVSFRDSTGKWGMPSNLGPAVNTEADERHVTLTRDGSIVYFSSNRDGGEYRIYMLVPEGR